jgi:hypothetical protein
MLTYNFIKIDPKEKEYRHGSGYLCNSHVKMLCYFESFTSFVFCKSSSDSFSDLSVASSASERLLSALGAFYIRLYSRTAIISCETRRKVS